MADEARAMLDALMGGDRNAPLPQGAAAVKRGQHGEVILPSKKKKSCYDYDICPLYCAWNGVDVYELFVNTKSDIGPNPKIPSDGALQEFQRLPSHEQERLGYPFLLFQKLQDLVRMCDRTVARNKEKLVQEKRKGNANIDYVTAVDEREVEQVCRTQLELDDLVQELQTKEIELEEVMKQEAELQERYEKEQREKEQAEASAEKKEDGGSAIEEQAKGETEETPKEEASKEDNDKDGDAANPKEEEAKENEDLKEEEAKAETAKEEEAPKGEEEESPLQKEMSTLLLKRQRLLFDLARTMQQYAPVQQAKESQMDQLHYLKSDITSDKTVCEVSGNFMSARDADERIAAHYAGKQYVGWKLVRDKLKEMIEEYGRYGPPPGEGGRRGPGDGRGGGDSRYGGGGRGGDRYSRGDGRWERGHGGGGYSRGHGDYNRGHGGGGDYYRREGGGGGRDRGHWRR